MLNICFSGLNSLYLYYTNKVHFQTSHIMNKLALILAHQIKSNFSTWSEALKTAWNTIKLKSQLRKGIAHFFFTKSNGEVREMFGTLKFDTPYISTSKREKPWYQISFVDTMINPTKNNWRSCDIRNFIKFN